MKKNTTLKNIGLFILALIATQIPQFGLLIAGYSSKLPFTILGSFMFFALYALLIFCFKKIFIKEKVFKKLKGMDVLIVVASYLFIYFIKMIYSVLSTYLYKNATTANDAALNKMLGTGGATTFMMITMIAFLAPLCEELLFRGMFFEKFFKGRIWQPILVSGLLFGCVHISSNLVSFLLYFIMGLVFGWVYHKTKNLSASLLLHIVNNIPVLLAMLLAPGMFNS